MKNFEFKSQICTDINQSRKLLELGLKNEIADMVWIKELAWDEVAHCTYDAETYMLRPIDYLEGESHRGHIPAWSLHRLMEIIQDDEKEISYILDREDLVIEWFDDGGYKNKFFRHIENTYDRITSCIEWMIKEGVFSPEYLEEQV